MRTHSDLPGENPSPRASDPLPPHPPLNRYYSTEEERRRKVQGWFDETATHYDFITQMMSLGSGHRYRRQTLVRAGLTAGMNVLDVACGTGVLAAHAREIVGDGGSVTGLDASGGMLQEARGRGIRRLTRGLAESLPFQGQRFDLLSMGYALRHVADLHATFREYRRVLKPGGRLLILEMAPPRSRVRFRLLKLYLGRVVPWLARLGGGGRRAQELMEYYWDTVENCVAPEVILGAMEEAGFSKVEWQSNLGILNEYSGVR